MFLEAFNRVQETGSDKNFNVTKDYRIYIDLSSPCPATLLEIYKPNPSAITSK